MAKKSYKNNLTCYIAYVTVRDLLYATANNVNPLYISINKINEHIEESDGNKYLTLLLA